MLNFPPDIRQKYQETGGALEHYAEVNRLNHAYPMAHYFTGNVYNDWGSQVNNDSLNARAQGKMEDAQRLRQKATDMWDKAEAAYASTKKLAPNYVQTHHQMGLLEVKRGEMNAAWGEMDKAKEHYAKAEHYFRLYNMIDPVFPPNYDRLAQLLSIRGQFQEAAEFYKQAIYYNDEIAKSIYKNGFPDRIAALSLSLAKTYYNLAVHTAPDPFHPLLPAVNDALKYFQMSVDADSTTLEAWKGIGFLYNRMGKPAEAQQAWRKAHEIAPNDPDLKVTAPPR
jgi:tetratricopeptide (TPR) repeat protein